VRGGGSNATITDVNLLLGVLDPTTYLDGGFTLDADRSKAVITATVAGPMSACGAARLTTVKTVLVPKLAAVFSIGFGGCGLGDVVKVSCGAQDDCDECWRRPTPAPCPTFGHLRRRIALQIFPARPVGCPNP
jgi:N-methylhydantoinase A/oxoprolinase/acetone carboxylase beta subunit